MTLLNDVLLELLDGVSVVALSLGDGEPLVGVLSQVSEPLVVLAQLRSDGHADGVRVVAMASITGVRVGCAATSALQAAQQQHGELPSRPHIMLGSWREAARTLEEAYGYVELKWREEVRPCMGKIRAVAGDSIWLVRLDAHDGEHQWIPFAQLEWMGGGSADAEQRVVSDAERKARS